MNTPPSGMRLSSFESPQKAGVEVTHVRGLILAVVKSVLCKGMDASQWESFVSGLTTETRKVFQREVGDYEWVPMSTIMEAAIRRAPSFREQEVGLLRGNIYAEQMMTKHHQWMLKVMTPELFIRQSPRIFAFYHQGGEMAVERVDPNGASVTLRASGPAASWFSILLPTWFKRALELSGGEGVEVIHEPPDLTSNPQLHRYWLSWT